jgi:hypothetical protein
MLEQFLSAVKVAQIPFISFWIQPKNNVSMSTVQEQQEKQQQHKINIVLFVERIKAVTKRQK